METRTYAEAVAAEVRASLARKGMKQTVLAESVGMSNASMSRKLKGANAFTADELLTIAPLLDTTASTLMAAAEATMPEAVAEAVGL